MHNTMRYIIGSICVLTTVWICCESFVNKAQNTNQNLKSVNEVQEQIQENVPINTDNKIKLDNNHYLIKEGANVYISCSFIPENKSEEITVYVPVKQEDYNEFLSANISVADLIKKADTAIIYRKG